MKLANSRRSQRGFTLAELAIVLLILTVLTATLLIPFSGREEIRQRHQAQATLQDIRDALLGFAIIHRRLPCPSRETNPSDPGYGLEDPGCNQAAEGYLPWRTLGIAPFDPWGIERQSSLDPWLGYWRYRVDEEFADAANPIDIETEVDDEIKIQDSGGNAMVDDKTLVAVIYSTGANRIVGDLFASSGSTTISAWVWATKYPDMMDAVVPMACQPGAMSGRNWILRRLLADSIRNDPEWNNGNYTTQPRNMSRLLTYFSIATSNGNINLYNAAPTAAQGDAFLAKRIATPFRGDANDVLYQWESSADYDPSQALERVQATVLAINAADDERNPPELGMMERAMKRVKNGRYLQIPQSAETRGHGTTGMAKFYRKELAELLEQAPRRR